MVENRLSQISISNKYIRRQIEDKDYIKSNIGKGLPHLPVPNLDGTLRKYLRCLKTIQSQEEFNRTKYLVDQFYSSNNSIGHRLQDMLVKHAAKSENYIMDWWLEDMYLSNLLPLPINSNPAFVLPRQNFTDSNDYLKFTSKFISSVLDYKILIDTRALPIDRTTTYEKGQPLCMEQYYRLFSCYRMPGKEQDQLIKIRNNPMEHIIIAYRNQFFVLEVIVNSKHLDEDDIFILLKRIIRIVEENPDEIDDVGIFTSLPRQSWANVRTELINDELNRNSLDLIEQCIFLVCLDQSNEDFLFKIDELPQSIKRDFISLAEQILHGGKNMLNCSNRWYDKTIQFIIGIDGVFGLNYEHSPAEAIVIIQLIEYIFKYMKERNHEHVYHSKSLYELPIPYRLKWNLNKFLRENISIAKESLQNEINNLDFYILKFTDYGKQFPKEHNISPDVFIQLCLQLTYFKMYNKLVSTYETASTRRFHLGRVDNIRANTPETLEWVQAMIDKTGGISVFEKLRLFRQAIKVQTDLIIQNILGHGMDCHMLALKQIARDNNLSIPDLYLDPGYTLSNHFNISTSQVTTNIIDSFICYGAVVPDGYGCSYNLHSDFFLFCISSFHNCSTTNSRDFADLLIDTLYEIRDLCTSVQQQRRQISMFQRSLYTRNLLHHL